MPLFAIVNPPTKTTAFFGLNGKLSVSSGIHSDIFASVQDFATFKLGII